MGFPQRIISLISSATEILFAIGVGDRVVAISHECDFPPEIAGRPRVSHSLIESARSSSEIDDQVRQLSADGQSLYQLDIERIAQLRPQLIVTQSQCDVCAIAYDQVVAMVEQDPRLRDTRILSLNPTSLVEVLADVARIGSATGAELAASKFIATLQARIDAVASRTAALQESERPRTVCIEWIEPLMLAANWTPEIIEMGGGQHGLTMAGRHSSYGNWEAVISYDPEVILVVPCGFDLPRTLEESRVLQHRPGWHGLTAVKSSRVFAVDGSAYFNRSGPRLVDSLEIAAHILHPQLFPKIGVGSLFCGLKY